MAQDQLPSPKQAIAAVEEFRRRLRLNPRDASTYRALGRALRFLGADEEANEAELDAVDVSQHDPDLARAARALIGNDLASAEQLLRTIVRRRPDDAAAVRMLADVAIRAGFPQDAERLARHALALAPGFDLARLTLAAALDKLGLAVEALEQLNEIGGPLAENPEAKALSAAVLGKLGEHERAVELLREVAKGQPETPGIWLSIGDQLRVIAGVDKAVAAYRRELELSPISGEAWWSLANIKTFDFTDADIAAMQAALASQLVVESDRAQLHFALGKALEDRGEDELSFRHYEQGNAIIAAAASYNPAMAEYLIEQTERLFTAEFMRERAHWGCKTEEPIFIVGLTRSGSTLIEQILASHSRVEGTSELPDVIVLAKGLERPKSGTAHAGWHNYPEVLQELGPDDFQRLGQSYISRTRLKRKTDRPLFTDKMPNNWFHVGFIRLMLPNAKIIDARRHPLACGFANFKQYYGEGQEFTYDLEQFGLHYRHYVRLMAHFDAVSPGRVHRVIHERLLADPEVEIRKLLDYLGLPFEDACLRFYETKRQVKTVSAEQVRRPIDPTRMHQWRRFEKWLGPLKRALGPVLETWDH